MLIEMHCHSREYSPCSHVSAVDLVKKAFELGLQGIVLTDHHHLWSEEALADLRQDAGVQDFFLVLSGQETATADFGNGPVSEEIFLSRLLGTFTPEDWGGAGGCEEKSRPDALRGPRPLG